MVFPAPAGFRAELGQKVIYFNPKDRCSARYNPLLMVRKGDNEVADMQRLILTLFGRAPKDFWEKGGGRMLLAIGLHILHGEPNSEKSLAGMAPVSGPGRRGPGTDHGREAHPLAARIAQGFFPGGVGGKDADRVKGMRSGLYFTARDFLAFYDDPVAAEITSGLCRFRAGRSCPARRPDQRFTLSRRRTTRTRAAPLMNLIIGQILGELVSTAWTAPPPATGRSTTPFCSWTNCRLGPDGRADRQDAADAGLWSDGHDVHPVHLAAR